MVSNPIQQAVVLATSAAMLAGRHRSVGLAKTGGISQLRRTLLTLQRRGVRRFVVVTGAADEALRQHVADDAQLAALDIVWVRNAERPADQGYSLLQASPHLRGAFYVTSVDRVFAPQVLDALLQEPLDGATLAVSSEHHPEGAISIALGTRGQVLGFGRGDHSFTGIASADRRLVDVLVQMREAGAGTDLLDAFTRLDARGQLRVADIGDAYFLPIANDKQRKQAQNMLLAALRKSVDGLISRHINRRFSLAMTRILMHTRVRPNHVTAFALLVSIAGAVTASFATAGNAWWLLVGAVFWQLASMLDGIDGELARLKFAESKIGEWFDTLTDDIGKFVFFVGSGVGAAAVSGQSLWLQLCLISVAIQAALSINLYRKLLKTGSGSHYALAWEVDDSPKQSWPARLYRRIEFMSRRDYYVFAWMALVAFGFFKFAIVITFLTTATVLVHEVIKPRQARENFPVRPPAS
jgi:CDP-L-myo-inositol myo-inositolphosphotransferase